MCLEGGGCGEGLLREEGRDHQFVKELVSDQRGWTISAEGEPLIF
jgi:hypothetical protein